MAWCEEGRWYIRNVGSGEVEDIGHFVLRCEYVAKKRERMERLMGEREEGWYEMDSNEKVVMMTDRACRDETVARAVERMWRKRFVTHDTTHHRLDLSLLHDDLTWAILYEEYSALCGQYSPSVPFVHSALYIIISAAGWLD